MNTWVVYAFGSAVFAALTAILGKVGVEGVNSNLATFIRTIVILIVAALLVSARGEWQRPDSISTKTYIFLVLSGIATGLSWLCYYRALQLGPASKVAPIDKLSVVFVIIMALVFLGEKLTLKSAIGAGMIAVGSLVLAF